MSSTSYYTDGQALFVGALDRAANYPGYEWAGNAITNSSGSLSGVNGAITTAFGTIASTGLTTAQVNTISTNLIGRDLLAGGVAWVQGLYTSTGSLSQTVLDVYNTVMAEGSGTDYTVLTDRMSAANTFTNYYAPSGTGYSATEASSYIDQITPAWVGLGNTTSSLQSVSNYVNGTTGQTVDIKTTQLNYSASSSNTTFIDNGIALTAAYTINGVGGNDELKMYALPTVASGTIGLPTLNNVPYLFANLLNANDNLTLDTHSNSGITSVVIDDVYTTHTFNATLTGATQTLTIENSKDADVNVSYQTTDTSATIGLSNGTKTQQLVLNVKSGDVATLTLDVLNSSSVVFENSSTTKVSALNIEGSAPLYLTIPVAGTADIKTINASLDTSNLTVIDENSTSSFAFTGGSGTNTLAITLDELGGLTSGSQLEGGTGSSNNLILIDLLGTGVISAGDYTNINKSTGFHTLGFSEEGATTLIVNASSLSGSMATNFIIGTDMSAPTASYTINDMANNSNVTVLASSVDLKFSPINGATTLNLNIGSSSTGTTTISNIATTGFSIVNILSTTSSSAKVNTITTGFTNSDNTTFNITGSGNFTMGVAGATTTGDDINASKFTGKFILTADSGKGDVISTGSGTTTIKDSIAVASSNTYAIHDSITLLAGHTTTDTYTVSAHANNLTGTTVFNADTITNFALNQDIITGTAAGTTELTSTKGVVSSSAYSSAAKFITAAESIATAATAGDVQIWYDSTHGNTYVAEYVATAAAGSGASDAHIVELVGVHATSIEGSATTGASSALIVHPSVV